MPRRLPKKANPLRLLMEAMPAGCQYVPPDHPLAQPGPNDVVMDLETGEVKRHSGDVSAEDLRVAVETLEWLRQYHQTHKEAADRLGVPWRVPRVWEVRQCPECGYVYPKTSVTPLARRKVCPICKEDPTEVLKDSAIKEALNG